MGSLSKAGPRRQKIEQSSGVVNLLVNSAFVGAVAATPGTAPTGWSLSGTGGSLAIPQPGQITFACNSGLREFILQAVTIPANSPFCVSADLSAVSGGAADNVFQIVLTAGAYAGAIVPGAGGRTVAEGAGRKTITGTAGAAGATFTVRMGAGPGAATTANTSMTVKEPQVELAAAFSSYQAT